jgi:hypothetical protein
MWVWVWVYMWENERPDQFYKSARVGLNKFETAFWNSIHLAVSYIHILDPIKKSLVLYRMHFEQSQLMRISVAKQYWCIKWCLNIITIRVLIWGSRCMTLYHYLKDQTTTTNGISTREKILEQVSKPFTVIIKQNQYWNTVKESGCVQITCKLELTLCDKVELQFNFMQTCISAYTGVMCLWQESTFY